MELAPLVILGIVALLACSVFGVVWSAVRTGAPDLLGDGSRTTSSSEVPTSAGAVCSHLPIDNPRVSGARGGF